MHLVLLGALFASTPPQGWGISAGRRVLPAKVSTAPSGSRPVGQTNPTPRPRVASTQALAGNPIRPDLVSAVDTTVGITNVEAVGSTTTTALNPSRDNTADSGENLDVGQAVAAGDVDGDGDIDLVVGSAILHVLINDGVGGFSVGSTLDGVTTIMPSSQATNYMGTVAARGKANFCGGGRVQVGDLTGDGKDDILVADWTGVFLYTNDGAGSFGSPHATVFAGQYQNSYLSGVCIALADIDTDGDNDVVMLTWQDCLQSGNSGMSSCEGEHIVRTLTNDGSGNLIEGTNPGRSLPDGTIRYTCGTADGAQALCHIGRLMGMADASMQMGMAVGDLDGDGRVDVLATDVVRDAPPRTPPPDDAAPSRISPCASQ